MNPTEIASYLKSHPEFFEEFADVLSSVQLPHPHGGRAISLSERQMLTLREKNKALELRIAELLRFGQENDAILDRLQRWTRGLLLQRNARALPDAMMASLSEIFLVPDVALRVWETADEYADLPMSQAVAPEVVRLANELSRAYVGTPGAPHQPMLALLAHSSAQSVAILPLHRGASAKAFGVIVLASPDPRRFHGGLGTEVLGRIAETASAALTRLLA
ncbi:MAG: DUF484 family protein [Burkholderiaceae bacterium]|jgi:uncharacterized protein YigA (DUF484 family)